MFPLFLLRIISSEIGHILVRQAPGYTPHAGVLTVTLLICFQRILDVLGRLTTNFGDRKNFGKSSFISGDAVATDTHGSLVFGCLGVTDHVRGGEVGNARKREKCK